MKNKRLYTIVMVVILIIIYLLPNKAEAQTKPSKIDWDKVAYITRPRTTVAYQDSIMYSDNPDTKINIRLSILELKGIRHDAIIKVRFKYAHLMNLEIQKEKLLLCK